MSKVPVIVSKNIDSVVRLVDNCINIAKENWDDIETSWDFEMHPLIKKGLRWSDMGAKSASLYKYYNIKGHWIVNNALTNSKPTKKNSTVSS